jgi:hypothetical protein
MLVSWGEDGLEARRLMLRDAAVLQVSMRPQLSK